MSFKIDRNIRTEKHEFEIIQPENSKYIHLNINILRSEDNSGETIEVVIDNEFAIAFAELLERSARENSNSTFRESQIGQCAITQPYLR